jgi:acyl-CoA synthetase (AMP-forming)/AMP-acid ligase II
VDAAHVPLQRLRARVVHLYGLNETHGPYSICEARDGWDLLDIRERSKLMARQGVAMIATDGIRVVDEQMQDVPRDAATMREVVMGGNNVMKGYCPSSRPGVRGPRWDRDGTANASRGGLRGGAGGTPPTAAQIDSRVDQPWPR